MSERDRVDRSMLTIRVLGCGSSGGVPQIGGGWGRCDPSEPRNYRLRTSLLLSYQGERVLVDPGPDLRVQLMTAKVNHLAAVVVTHDHADHVHGIDDLRWIQRYAPSAGIDEPTWDGLIPLMADRATCESLCARFGYIVAPAADTQAARSARLSEQTSHIHNDLPNPLYRKRLGVQSVDTAKGAKFELTAGLWAQSIPQRHGPTASMGLRINSFAYTTDVSDFDPIAWDILKGVEVWVVGCLREDPHPAHAHLEKVLEWIERIQPRLVYFTHMNNTMDYQRLKNRLPKWIEPAYDGLEITIESGNLDDIQAKDASLRSSSSAPKGLAAPSS